MQNSVEKRIAVTKTGKVRHRSPALGHSRANKNATQLRRKRGLRALASHKNTLAQYLHN